MYDFIIVCLSWNGTNLFDVTKNKNEKCERRTKRTAEGGEKLSDLYDNDRNFHVLTNGVERKVDWLQGKIEYSTSLVFYADFVSLLSRNRNIFLLFNNSFFFVPRANAY